VRDDAGLAPFGGRVAKAIFFFTVDDLTICLDEWESGPWPRLRSERPWLGVWARYCPLEDAASTIPEGVSWQTLWVFVIMLRCASLANVVMEIVGTCREHELSTV